MKNIKCFNFKPDDHYAAPWINEIGDTAVFPLLQDKIIELYGKADYSYYSMVKDDYEEESEVDLKATFLDYGNWEIFNFAYICVTDLDTESLEKLINEAVDMTVDIGIPQPGYNMDELEVNKKFMEYLSRNQEIELLFSFPSIEDSDPQTYIYMDGKLITKFQGTLGDLEGPILYRIYDVIVKNFKNTSTRLEAGKIYNTIHKISPNIDDLLSQSLTPEEILSLRNTGKGSSMLSRFGTS